MADEKDRDSHKAVHLQPETWLTFAVSGAGLTLAIGAVMCFWIFGAETTEATWTRVQIVGAFMTVGLAIVTFCTVIWRGLISADQNDLQREQLNKLAEQMAETAKVNLADLLQRGAELLAADKPAQISAGIATLHAVAADPDERFSLQSMDLLADHIAKNGKHSHTNVAVRQAIDGMNDVYGRLGRESARIIRFETVLPETRWRLCLGLYRVEYAMGVLRDEILKRRAKSVSYFYFKNLKFENCIISADDRMTFSNCKFIRCSFLAGGTSLVTENTFSGCNFSGFKYDPWFLGPDFPDLSDGDNWFEADNPPTIDANALWSEQADVEWEVVLVRQEPAGIHDVI